MTISCPIYCLRFPQTRFQLPNVFNTYFNDSIQSTVSVECFFFSIETLLSLRQSHLTVQFFNGVFFSFEKGCYSFIRIMDFLMDYRLVFNLPDRKNIYAIVYTYNCMLVFVWNISLKKNVFNWMINKTYGKIYSKFFNIELEMKCDGIEDFGVTCNSLLFQLYKLEKRRKNGNVVYKTSHNRNSILTFTWICKSFCERFFFFFSEI